MVDASGDNSRLAEVVTRLGLHEHLCVIYETQEEQFAVALPYLRTGLERGEKCLYIVDENTAAAVLDTLSKGGTDVDRYLRDGALTIAHKEEIYPEQGRFEPDWMIGFLTEATAETGAGRFSRVRTFLAEMTWTLGTSSGTAKLIEFESKLNRFYRDHDARGICQYNRRLFPPELLLDVIRTHPIVVFGGMVSKNPYYVPPDEFLKPHQAERELNRLLHNIQEWERTQQALRQSEDHLRLVIDTIPTMAWSCRPDGTVDFLNQRWMDYTGLSLEQYVKEPTGPIYPDDVPRVMEKWRAGQAVGEPYEDEMRLRRADGEFRWFLVRTVPLRDERGNIVKWYGSSIDIEDRKRVGEELRASEERWRAVFENSAVGIALTHPEGRYAGSNRAYQEMVGYTDEELRGLSYLDITFEEDRKINRALAGELWQGKRRQFQLEKRYRRKDGSGIRVKATTSVVPDAQGKSRFAMSIVEDITEHTRAEVALRRSEAYLAAGQALSHTGSWAFNVSSGELFWSRETFSIFGFDPASATPSKDGTFLSRIHPEDRPEVDAGIEASETQKGSSSVDYRIVLPDGSIRYIHDVVYPVLNEAGAVVERYGVIMDVTERRRAEMDLQESRDGLRALAARLQMVREEERTRVAREIHDELGQALTAIKIDLSLLRDDLSRDHDQRFERILKEVDETIELVRKISTELRPGILDAVGLVAAIEWAAGEFESRYRTKCRLNLPRDEMIIDRERATALFRIFQETLTNVARHAEATEVNVRLAREDAMLILEIHDNGIGISEEQLSASGSPGILGMRERALLLGGECLISGEPHRPDLETAGGTLVKVLVPLSGFRDGGGAE